MNWILIIGLIVLLVGVGFTYLKKVKNWFLMHKILNLIGGIITVIGIILYPGFSVNLTHVIFSILAIIFVCLGLLGGFLYIRKKDAKKRKIHIWGGRVTVTIIAIVLIIGFI